MQIGRQEQRQRVGAFESAADLGLGMDALDVGAGTALLAVCHDG
ncbi:hypothetical protein ACXJY9_001905 [Salmonella enterica]